MKLGKSPESIREVNRKESHSGRIFQLLGEATWSTLAYDLAEQKCRAALAHWPQEEREGKIKAEIITTLDLLMSMPQMVQCRERARTLYEEFSRKVTSGMNMQSTTEGYYLREAEELWRQAERFTRDFIECNSGRMHIDSLQGDVDGIVTGIIRKLEMATSIRHEKNRRGLRDVFFAEFSVTSWPKVREKFARISFSFSAANDAITHIGFTNQYNIDATCRNADMLATAYNRGAVLSISQMQLLKDKGYIAIPDNPQALRLPKDALPLMTPLRTYPHLLSEEMRRKMAPLSLNMSRAEMQGEVESIKFNSHSHQSGDWQDWINFNLTTLHPAEQKKDLNALVKAFVLAMKEFPVVNNN